MSPQLQACTNFLFRTQFRCPVAIGFVPQESQRLLSALLESPCSVLVEHVPPTCCDPLANECAWIRLTGGPPCERLHIPVFDAALKKPLVGDNWGDVLYSLAQANGRIGKKIFLPQEENVGLRSRCLPRQNVLGPIPTT